MILKKFKTAYCKQKEALCLLNGTPLEVSKIVIGDGNGIIPEISEDTTTLVNQRLELAIEVDKSQLPKYKFIANIPAEVEEFQIREMGIVDKDGKLLYVTQMEGMSTTLLSSGISKQIRLQMQFTPAEGVNIIVIDPTAATASTDYVDSKIDTVIGTKITEITTKFANYRPIEIGAPIPTLSDNLPDNAIWLEGAKVAKADYPALYNVYGDKYYITNFEDVGLISSGVQFEYSGKLTNYSSRNFIQTAEKFITNGRPWSIRFRHKTPNAFSADYSLLGNATGVNYKQAIEFDVMTTGLLRLCISSNGTSYDIVPVKIGTNKLLVDTWYDIILKFTGSAYIVTFKQVVEDAEVNNEGEWTTDLNIASEVAIYENAEDGNLLCLGNHVYTASAQLPCLGVIDFTKSHILTTSENATENFDTVFWKWTKKRDEDVDYFKLPDARNRVLWGTTESNFGYLLPALPNIVGTYRAGCLTNGGITATGALYPFSSSARSYGDSGSGHCFGFNANRSNSIYKDGSTVVPPALKYRTYTYYA